VSPTSALHVFNDLYDKDLSIIDGENCQFGIESTVVKINESSEGVLSLLILRNGSISEKALSDFLKSSERYSGVTLSKIKKEHAVSEEENSAAPGQLLKHYSPNCETFLLNFSDVPLDSSGLITDIHLKKVAVIDFAKKASWLKDHVLAYYCISDDGLILEAMNRLYDSLRWAENIDGVSRIIITNIEEAFRGKEELTEFLETIYDKIYRSSCGKKIFCVKNELSFYSA
jgi:L-threonylcarbamoyladenylate synthase